VPDLYKGEKEEETNNGFRKGKYRGGRSGDRREAGSECDGGNTKEGRRGNARQQCGWLRMPSSS